MNYDHILAVVRSKKREKGLVGTNTTAEIAEIEPEALLKSQRPGITRDAEQDKTIL